MHKKLLILCIGLMRPQNLHALNMADLHEISERAHALTKQAAPIAGGALIMLGLHELATHEVRHIVCPEKRIQAQLINASAAIIRIGCGAFLVKWGLKKTVPNAKTCPTCKVTR